MKRMIAVVLLLAGALPACEKKPPPPPPQEKQEPTAQEIQSAFSQALSGMGQFMQPQDELTYAVRQEIMAGKDKVLEQVRQAKNKYQMGENWPEAEPRIVAECERWIREAKKVKAWGAVYIACEAYEALEPHSSKFVLVKQHALDLLNKPWVVVKGFIENPDTKETYVFLRVRLMETGERHEVQVRPGEEFFGYRFIEIIGKNRGVRLEYLKTHDVFDFLTPRAREMF